MCGGNCHPEPLGLSNVKGLCIICLIACSIKVSAMIEPNYTLAMGIKRVKHEAVACSYSDPTGNLGKLWVITGTTHSL